MSYWQKHSFLTLTYDDKHIPPNGSLRKKDLQNFFKRMRKIHDFKYFGCGEYGEDERYTHRPHYHIIMLGVGLKDRYDVMDNWKNCDWSVPKIRKDSFGVVEAGAIDYVVRYMDKKLEEEVENGEVVKEAPFHVVSKGMGLRFAKDNADQIQSQGYSSRGGVRRSIPRYYAEKLGIDLTDAKERVFEKEEKEIEKTLGISGFNRDAAYRLLCVDDNIKLEEADNNRRRQHDKNLRGKLRLKRSREIGSGHEVPIELSSKAGRMPERIKDDIGGSNAQDEYERECSRRV